ncbi:unnamed protein product [Urochloa humidicola]
MTAEEAGLRFALVGLVANPSLTISAADAARDIAAVVDFSDDVVTVKPFHPDNFLVICGRQDTQDRILSAHPIPLAGTSLLLRPWTRLVNADSLTLYARVQRELVGIPPHAWTLTTVRKLLAPYCWVEKLEPTIESKADLSLFSLFAWTKDPFAIPQFRRLGIAERELPVVHSDPDMQLIFGRVTPYLRQKSTLIYPVEIHLRSVADFASRSPSTASPSSPSEDGDSGPGSDPRRSYGFRQGPAGPRLFSFLRRDSTARDCGGVRRAADGCHDNADGQQDAADVGPAAPGLDVDGHVTCGTSEVGPVAGAVKAAPKEKVQPPTGPSVCFVKADSNKQITTTGNVRSPPVDETMAGSPLTSEPVQPAAPALQLPEITQSVAFEVRRSQEAPPTRDEDPMLIELYSNESAARKRVENSVEESRASHPLTVVASVCAVPTGSHVTVTPHEQLMEDLIQSSDSVVHNSRVAIEDGPSQAQEQDDGLGHNSEPATAGKEVDGCWVMTPTRKSTSPGPMAAINDTAAPSSPDGGAALARDAGSAKLSAFAKAVQRKVRSPLAPRPAKTKRAAPLLDGQSAKLTKRSERLANHPLAMVASSKRAEVVLKRRLGMTTEEPQSPAAKQVYKKFYAEEVRSRNFEAVRDLLPSLRSVCPAVGLQA